LKLQKGYTRTLWPILLIKLGLNYASPIALAVAVVGASAMTIAIAPAF
jgi:hypothetical protein